MVNDKIGNKGLGGIFSKIKYFVLAELAIYAYMRTSLLKKVRPESTMNHRP